MEYISPMVFSEKDGEQTVSNLHQKNITKKIKKSKRSLVHQIFLPISLPRPTFPSSAALTQRAKPSSAA